MWYHFLGEAIGYTFAVVVGHFVIQAVVDRLWIAIGWDSCKTSERPEYYLPRLVGIVERALYVASLQMDKPQFIGIWLALKVAGQWYRWGANATIGGRSIEGRVFYNIFLIGNGLSIAYSVGGAKMIIYFDASHWGKVLTLPVAILIGTGALHLLGKYWKRKVKE